MRPRPEGREEGLSETKGGKALADGPENGLNGRSMARRDGTSARGERASDRERFCAQGTDVPTMDSTPAGSFRDTHTN